MKILPINISNSPRLNKQECKPPSFQARPLYDGAIPKATQELFEKFLPDIPDLFTVLVRQERKKHHISILTKMVTPGKGKNLQHFYTINCEKDGRKLDTEGLKEIALILKSIVTSAVK